MIMKILVQKWDIFEHMFQIDCIISNQIFIGPQHNSTVDMNTTSFFFDIETQGSKLKVIWGKG